MAGNLPPFALYTDSELFGWTRQARQQRRRFQSSVAPELFFADVNPNDYVVHMEHGIGVYEGLKRLEMGGVERGIPAGELRQGRQTLRPRASGRSAEPFT